MRTMSRPLASLFLVALACRPAPMQPVAEPQPVAVAPEPAPEPAPAPALPETWVGTIAMMVSGARSFWKSYASFL